MAQTFKKEKVEDLYKLIQIFYDETNKKLMKHGSSMERNYLIGQLDAYSLIQKIMEKDFEITTETKMDKDY